MTRIIGLIFYNKTNRKRANCVIYMNLRNLNGLKINYEFKIIKKIVFLTKLKNS